jgi:hypothetical protein
MKFITKTNLSCGRCLGVTNACVVTAQVLSSHSHQQERHDTVACLSDLQAVCLNTFFALVTPGASALSSRDHVYSLFLCERFTFNLIQISECRI